METAAAILTKIIFENNTALRDGIAKFGPHANAVDFGTAILPIYRGILEQLRPPQAPGSLGRK